MDDGFSPGRIAIGIAALVVLLAAGAIGFHSSLDETWLQALYRSVVTISLAGLLEQTALHGHPPRRAAPGSGQPRSRPAATSFS